MKKLLSLVLLSTFSFGASAGIFDNVTDQTELANVLLHCSADTVGFLDGMAFISKIESKHTNINKGLDVKIYTLKSQIPQGFGRVRTGPTLTIKLEVTQPPVGSYDMPARSEYKCTIN